MDTNSTSTSTPVEAAFDMIVTGLDAMLDALVEAGASDDAAYRAQRRIELAVEAASDAWHARKPVPLKPTTVREAVIAQRI